MVSLRQGEQLRMARGTLVLLAREIGYNIVELLWILKWDVSVLSCLASIGETRAREKTLRWVRGDLKTSVVLICFHTIKV
jgi:hypothetical protein